LKIISQEEGISAKYLERIVSDLKKSKIVKSIKGKGGGYVLANAPQKMKAGQVIEAVEGPIAVKCYGTKCQMKHRCPSSVVWIKLGEQIKKTLYGIRLSDLIK
jgi:Rrf2 family iron-sulfur cluster assembly transcriptional regulator